MVPQSEEELYGSYMNCVCAEGATCHRYMHKEGVACDRTVYLTKNSRHRICKGCRSTKRKRPDGEGAGGTQVRDSSGRGSRIEEDEEEEEEVVEEEEKREEKEKNKSKEADHSIDLLHLLAAHASTRVSARVRASVEEQAREKARAVVPPPAPAPAPAPKVVYNAPYNRRPPQGARPRGRPRKVTTETNDQNFYYASASTSATSATANAANVAKRLKVEVVGSGGGGTKKYVFCSISVPSFLVSVIFLSLSFSLLFIYRCLSAFSGTIWHESNHHSLPFPSINTHYYYNSDTPSSPMGCL